VTDTEYNIYGGGYMDVNIRIEQGRCHQCGHEYVILSRKVEHPKELKVPAAARCPECGVENPVTFGSQQQFVQVQDENLEELSEILLQHTKCAECGKLLPLLSGERVDLVFAVDKVINEAEGLVEERILSAPFCQQCKIKETEESCIIASQKYFEAEHKGSTIDMLRKAVKEWRS
jgi:DNA-directed RNA polymerase subunit RPC12/RpoP